MAFPDQENILKILKEIKSGKIKATELISDDASPIDKMKFNICQRILKFKRENDYSSLEISKILNVGPAVVSRILHCQINKFKVDSLLNYYFALILSTNNPKLIKEFHKELAGFLKKTA